MNWLDKVIDKHGDVIFIFIAALCIAAYLGVNWYVMRHGG